MRWGRLHAGVDIAVPAGTPIRAADSGTRRADGLGRRLRQLHVHRPRRRAVDVLRAPVALRDLAGRDGQPGPGDRLRRLHRATASATTCTSRRASTACRSTRWATCSPLRPWRRAAGDPSRPADAAELRPHAGARASWSPGCFAPRFLKELGQPADWAYEMVFAALVGGIVGARLWSVIENWDEAKDDLLGSLFSGSGLVFYGGALGGARRRARPGRGGAACSTSDVRRAPPSARHRLRGRADRLPARRRRRLRQAVERAVGDGLSERHRADHRAGAPDAGLRDAHDAPRDVVAVAPARTARRPAACSRSTSCWRGPSASSSSSCAATTASSPG